MSYLTESEIEQIRQCIESSNWPLNCDSWPCEANKDTNCLAFALGFHIIARQKIFTMHHYSFSKLEELIEYLINISGLEYRKVTSFDEVKNDEYVIQGYEWYQDSEYWFHVIRRNLDGKWVHKKGFTNGPTQILSLKYELFMCNKKNITCTFAVKKKAS